MTLPLHSIQVGCTKVATDQPSILMILSLPAKQSALLQIHGSLYLSLCAQAPAAALALKHSSEEPDAPHEAFRSYRKVAAASRPSPCPSSPARPRREHSWRWTNCRAARFPRLPETRKPAKQRTTARRQRPVSWRPR